MQGRAGIWLGDGDQQMLRVIGGHANFAEYVLHRRDADTRLWPNQVLHGCGSVAKDGQR
jgi:hypothetical protein